MPEYSVFELLRNHLLQRLRTLQSKDWEILSRDSKPCGTIDTSSLERCFLILKYLHVRAFVLKQNVCLWLFKPFIVLDDYLPKFSLSTVHSSWLAK